MVTFPVLGPAANLLATTLMMGGMVLYARGEHGVDDAVFVERDRGFIHGLGFGGPAAMRCARVLLAERPSLALAAHATRAAKGVAAAAPEWPFRHLSTDSFAAVLTSVLQGDDEMAARLAFAVLDVDGAGALSRRSLRLLVFHWGRHFPMATELLEMAGGEEDAAGGNGSSRTADSLSFEARVEAGGGGCGERRDEPGHFIPTCAFLVPPHLPLLPLPTGVLRGAAPGVVQNGERPAGEPDHLAHAAAAPSTCCRHAGAGAHVPGAARRAQLPEPPVTMRPGPNLRPLRRSFGSLQALQLPLQAAAAKRDPCALPCSASLIFNSPSAVPYPVRGSLPELASPPALT